jgi:AcrR family transcriptional regulator
MLHTQALADGAIVRKPRQGRSLASFNRMLEATKALMLERGSEDFTLQDVSERGNVSVGSIYLRFESKDRLLHAVIAEELKAIIAGEEAFLDQVLAKSSNLAEFLPLFVEGYSDFLGERAMMLRTIMQRASVDPAVSEPGKETARKSLEMSIKAILTFADEIKSDDAETKASTVYHIVFATVARQHGLGSTAESGDDKVWNGIKDEVAKMALAYLKHAD